jgi:predicted RNA binding protein YcfA (HicA-like mRNA interferase family)
MLGIFFVTLNLAFVMKAKDVIKLVEENGWYFERQTGSHKIFKHPVKPGIIVIPEHGKEDIKPGTLNSILKQAGLK